MKKHVFIGAVLFLLPTLVFAQVIYPNRGGTGTTTTPTTGQVLVGQPNGTYAPQATSTLGISGGSGLATTSIDTESELESILTDVTDVFTNNDGALSDDDLSNNSTTDLGEGTNLYYTVARIQSALTSGYNAIFGNSTTTNATTTNLAVTNSFNFLGTVITNVSTWFNGLFDTRFATKTTDNLAEGTTNKYNKISTSTTPTNGHLSYWTSGNTLGSVATGTLTETVSGLQLDNTRGLIGGSAILSLTSGFGIPSTTDFTNWNTAFSWGNHASQGYLSTTSGNWAGTFDGLEGTSFLARANHTGTQLASTISDFVDTVRTSISETITGIGYNNSTGVFSLDAGYNIPLTASTTEWANFYATPSTRITAGTGLSWSGNTINASGGSGSNWTIETGGLRTSTTTDYAKASYFVGTSTTATSTIAGNATIAGNLGVDTDTLFVNANNNRVSLGTTTASYQLDQYGSTTVPFMDLAKLHRLTLNVSPTASDLTTQGTRALEVNTNAYGSYNMGTLSGIYALTKNFSTTGSTTHMIGVAGRVWNEGGANIEDAFGVYGNVNTNGTGTIKNAYGLYSNSPLIATGTVDNYYGIGSTYSSSLVTGTVKNAYGAFLAVPTGATNNNIGLIVGGAPSGANNLAAYLSGAVTISGATNIAGLLTPSGGVYLNTFNLPYNGAFQVKNKAGSAWINFATRNTGGSESVVDLSSIGTISTDLLTTGSSTANNTFAGKVGIGTTSPVTTLAVNGSTTITNNLQVNGGTFFVDATNNKVGLGTTTPVNRLNIITLASSSPAISFYDPSGGLSTEIRSGTSTQFNTFMGTDSGKLVSTGASNTGFGNGALAGITTGGSNTAIGWRALNTASTGGTNTAIGRDALYGLLNGSNNVGIGYQAGRYTADGATNNSTPADGIYIGNTARASATSNTREIVIGSTALGLGSNTMVLGSSTNLITSMYGNLGLGTTTPSHNLTVANSAYIGGSLQLIQALKDSVNATGTSNQILTSTGTSTLWTTPSSLCVAITGSADLCDGSDNASGGGGSLSTSTHLVPNRVLFATGTSTLGASANYTFDSNNNISLMSPNNVADTQAGLNIGHSDATGTSTYRIMQSDYDMLKIQRSGDTTGDGNAWTLMELHSPTATTSNSADSEATISLVTAYEGGRNYARIFDLYNDEYSRDQGMGFRQIYKGATTTANPIRFELHNTSTSSGAFVLGEIYGTSGNYSFTSIDSMVTGVTPSVDDWVWDNTNTYFADDTKITSVTPNTPSAGITTYGITRPLIGSPAGVGARGKNIKEIMRLTPDRQLLVRKTVASSTTNVAEFGGDVDINGSTTVKGLKIDNKSSSGLSWYFSSLTQAIVSAYGTITEYILNFAKVAITGKLYVATTTYNGATTSDAIVADGPINTGEWIQEFCTSPSAETTQIGADAIRACGRYAYIEDTNGVIDFVQPFDGTPSYFRIRTGAAGTTNVAGDGEGIGWASGIDFGDIQKWQPAMEFAMRTDAMANATSAIMVMGIANKIGVSADFATEPSQGIYLVASSTTANWQLACDPATGGTTYVNTGIATTSVTNLSATTDNPWTHFRLEVNGATNTAVTANVKARTSSNKTMTQVASCTIDVSASTGTFALVAPTIGNGRVSAGTLSSEIHLLWLKFWYKQPVF